MINQNLVQKVKANTVSFKQEKIPLNNERDFGFTTILNLKGWFFVQQVF